MREVVESIRLYYGVRQEAPRFDEAIQNLLSQGFSEQEIRDVFGPVFNVAYDFGYMDAVSDAE